MAKRTRPRSGARARKGATKTVSARRGPRTKGVVARRGGVTVSEFDELRQLQQELARAAGASGSPLRWNADPEDVQRSVAQLVLTLVELIRRLLERQAVRRMEAGTLTDQQIEDVGLALMNLEKAVIDIAARFGISPDELNLDLGPVGKLM